MTHPNLSPGSKPLFSTFLSQGVFADSMSERMKIREELSGVSSDGQNIMSASTAEDDHEMEIVHVAHVILDRPVVYQKSSLKQS